MKTEAAFWDTSAIIPLYCNQVMSSGSRGIRQRFSALTVWWGTHVEVHSALNRLSREGVQTELQTKSASEKWARLRSSARIIQPDDNILRIAASLTADNGIKALDAFQLSAALVWCRERPRKRPFVCADKQLGEAASEAGFEVVLIA